MAPNNLSVMNRREFLAASGATLAMLAGCGSGSGRSLPNTPGGQWRQYAQNAKHTSASDISVPPRANPAWDAGEIHTTAPLVADGTVFSAADEATALDAKTGESLWENDLAGSVDVTPAVTETRFVVGTDQEVVGLARKDGEKTWSRSLSRVPTGPITATTDPPTVVIPHGDESLLAINHQTGDKQWEAPLTGARSPAMADDTVYTAGYRDDDSGVLKALSVTDGSVVWEQPLEKPDTAPVIAGEDLVVTDGGQLAVHNVADGTRRRTLGTFGDSIREIPAVAGGTAYLESGESPSELLAVSISDGTIKWRVDAQVTADTGISVGRDAVVAAITDLPGLAAYERSDGTQRWTHTISGFDASASTPPVLAEDAVFYASNESTGVVALGDLPPQDES